MFNSGSYVPGIHVVPPPRKYIFPGQLDDPNSPGPGMVQERFVEGFDPTIGVRVEAMMPDPPEATAGGAESCREKLLVMVTAANACLAGSATLCGLVPEAQVRQ